MPRSKSILGNVVLGAHGAFCEWVFGVVQLLSDALPERTVLRIDRFDRIDLWDHSRPTVMTFYPSRLLIHSIDRGDVGVVSISEPPTLVASFLENALGVSINEAIRSQTASAVANVAIANNPHVLHLARETQRTAADLIRLLSQFLDLSVAPEAFDRIVDTATSGLGPAAEIEAVLQRSARYYVAPTNDNLRPAGNPIFEACNAIIEPLQALAKGDRTRPIVWPTSVFKFADEPDHPPPQVASISGPVRNLYYGPYLYLPPAKYRVEVILTFSDEIETVPFVIEVHAGSWLAKARILPRRAGLYRGYFVLDHHEPTETVEIRLRNDSTVASGRLSLIELLFFLENERNLT